MQTILELSWLYTDKIPRKKIISNLCILSMDSSILKTKLNYTIVLSDIGTYTIV